MLRSLGYTLATLILGTSLSACSGVKSAQVQSLQPTDKQLACADIKLEINEAEFFRRKAAENRGLSLRNVIMPHTYPSTFMSSSDAIGAADERVDYLRNIYAIRECDAKPETRMAEAPHAPQAPVAQPRIYSMAPQGYAMDYRPVPGYYPPAAGFMPQSYVMPHGAPPVGQYAPSRPMMQEF